jgi:hypothetical protein
VQPVAFFFGGLGTAPVGIEPFVDTDALFLAVSDAFETGRIAVKSSMECRVISLELRFIGLR